MAVYLKYILLSSIFALINYSSHHNTQLHVLTNQHENNSTLSKLFQTFNGTLYVLTRLCTTYASICLFGIACLFILRRHNALLGKNKMNGQLPLRSYIAFWPFHLWNYIEILSKKYIFRRQVEDVTMVINQWYIGGWFSDSQCDITQWEAIVDLTAEFYERAECKHYLNIPVWDGNPPSVVDIDRAAKFISKHAKYGPTLCHCAAGIGRSSTVMCAALVDSKMASDYKEAFKMIQAKRPIVRLNRKMIAALEEWQTWHKKQN